MREDPDLIKILTEAVDMLSRQQTLCWNWSPDGSLPVPDVKNKKLLTHRTLHINRAVEICLCLKGHAWLQLVDKTVVLEPGQFFVIPAGTLHNEAIPADEECLDLWLNLRQEQGIRAVLAGQNSEGEFGVLCCKAVLLEPSLKKLLQETLDNELNSDHYGARMLVKNRMLEILITMVRQLEREDQGSSKHWHHSVVAEVEDYLHHCCTDRIELQDLADHMAMSVKHLNRIFKDATGTTITGYANHLRIQQAQYYLTTTDMKVKDIAELLNYYDQYHFGRVFKKSVGVSPVEYRKTHKDQ